MKIQNKRRINQAVAFITAFCTVAQPTYALNLATEPLFVANTVTPQVMIALSKDQQLYKKAYNDYSDLDGDGIPETTYKHAVRYYGYFDPVKCYKYVNDRFEPTQITTYTEAIPGSEPPATRPANAYCDTATDANARWSGNFLNWASMSRMDAVRKILYGGTRIGTAGSPAAEEANITVLERAFVPSDAHAWAKFYDGSDIPKLTPFTALSIPTSINRISTDPITIQNSNRDIAIVFDANVTNVQVGDQVKLHIQTQPEKFMVGSVVSVSGKNMTLRTAIGPNIGFENTTTKNWTIVNLSSTGISFCNVTAGKTNVTSQANTNPPLMRVAKGNFNLWNANERWQCQWKGEVDAVNGNHYGRSDIMASASNPQQSLHGLGTGTTGYGKIDGVSSAGQYIVRIKACVSEALRGTENCRAYGANLKPVGVLQNYADKINFGLMTGSYVNNTAGGVLRKAVGSFGNEVNASTGVFQNVTGVVRTMNNMRIYGYNYGDGTYLYSTGDECNFQEIDIVPNTCTSWGNPMSEIYYEAIRYFAAKTNNQQTAGYSYNSGDASIKDVKLKLPLDSWTPPVSSTNVCSRLNVLAFNASVSSYDDTLGGTVAADIGSNKTITELTNAVGTLEGITNGSYFIGKRLGDDKSVAGFELCTAKTISAFGEASGICPEGPSVNGSYLIAGIAHQARTNPIRSDIVAKNNSSALRVTSYGIQLATNTPLLEIPVPGKAGQKVIIQPIYRLVKTDGSGNVLGFGGGSLVDLKIIRLENGPTSGSGKVYLNWEDSEQGGDYDQDMWGTLEWTINGTDITVTTNAVDQSTSMAQGFGYSITGTSADGPHFHSGINNFSLADDSITVFWTDPVTFQTVSFRGCKDCNNASGSHGQRGPTSVKYSLSSTGSTAKVLKDPLWYLSKYGGFDDRNGNGKLDGNEWDLINNVTGAAGSDGVPDTYFLVTNPLGLEAALERAFRGIAQQSSGSAVASSGASIKAGTAVYTASFRSAEWTGRLSAFKLKSDGTLESEEWDASAKLPAHEKRVILTYRNDTTARKGVPFRWPAVPASPGADEVGKNLVDALNMKTDNSGTSDGRGKERLQYLRGDASREGGALDSFRTRLSKLGDIVNSTPVFVPEVPNDVVLDPTYVDFQKQFLTAKRAPMVYVAANDGMLHGFDASVANASGTPSPTGGVERIAYVPSKTYSGLNQLTNPNYVHRYYVDGSPGVADAKVGGQWKTVLVGALGAGGRGIYALDVTNPPNIAASDATDAKTIESAAAAKVLWEFNVEDDVPSSGSKYGLGFVFGTPLIRKMNAPDGTERWAAIVSGGYNNTDVVPGTAEKGDGKGYIYILFLDGPRKKLADGRLTWEAGVDYVRLETTNGTVASPNGMAPPFPVDTNADGTVDYIYAGDLEGFFWKFDVSGKIAGNWNTDNNKVVLFKALAPVTNAAQPITTMASGIIHPTGQGYVLTFGTGKYLEPSDPSTTGTQTMYGIWDKNNKPGAIKTQITVPDRNALFKQIIGVGTKTNPDTGGTITFRYVTQTDPKKKAPDWTTDLGWYVDLPAAGERVVFDPVIASRRLIFSTLIPSGGVCDFGGTSFIMVVNPGTGGAFDVAVIDTDFNGRLTKDDTVDSAGHFAVGFESSVGITATPKVLLGGTAKGEAAGKDTTLLFNDNSGRVAGAGNRRAGIFVCGTSGLCAPPQLLGAGRDSGRATWREVVKK